MHLAKRPVFIFDGDCGFCRRWVSRWSARTGDRVRFVPLQTPLLRLRFGVGRANARKASVLLEPGGRVSTGATAVFRMLARAPGTRLAARLGLVPGVHQAAKLVYAAVAKNRTLAGEIDRLFTGRSPTPIRWRGTRWLFLRGVGLTYLVAFGSLRQQILGLYGSKGILPVDPWLQRIRPSLGKDYWKQLPTVLWRDASDRSLLRLCDAGAAASALLTFNVAPMASAWAAWAAWLSLASVGRTFLGFQWDALLLETGLQAALLAPAGLRPGVGRYEPTLAERTALRLLCFRLYYESGISKLRSGDPYWKQRTANRYYYETAPLPTPLGWYAHHLPPKVQDFSTRAALAIENWVPFLSFGTRRLRALAFGAFSILQGAIAATGNYAYFNFLSEVIGLSLVDDEMLPQALPIRTEERGERAPWHRTLPRYAALAPLFALQLTDLASRIGRRPPAKALALMEKTAAFHPVSSYGLFAMMTVERPELVLEGSDDAESWKPYALPFKPDALDQRPRWVAPHQPRLDWQLWFAALNDWPPRWFMELAQRMLEGSPEVMKLFARNPFPEKPPKYLRAVKYGYRMTDLKTKRETGNWWKREWLGLYLPPVTLQPN